MSCLHIKRYNICVSDFINVCDSSLIDICEDLDKYDLLDNININKHDVKTVIFFHILKRVCDIVISNRAGRCVFVCDTNKIMLCDFHTRLEVGRDKSIITTMCKTFNRVLPSLFFLTADDTSCLYKDIDCGESIDMIQSITNRLQSKSKKLFTFENVKRFVSKYGLTYISSSYFDKIKIKSLLYK